MKFNVKKLLVLLFIGIIFSSTTYATHDSVDKVYLVVADINGIEEYEVMSFPIVGCYGTGWGPRYTALTQEYMAPSNIGCGGEKMLDNLNALACSKLSDAVETDDYNYLKSLTVDITGCEQKTDASFVKAVEKAINKNFKTKQNPGFTFKLIK